jgi:phosphoglycerate dehydrogenase-like enzyme
MRKVVLTWQATPDEIARVRAALPAAIKVVAQPIAPALSRFDATYPSLADEVRDADAIMGWVLPPGILEIAHELKLISWLHAGCDELDFAALRRRGIRVANLRGANSTAVVEHAMALPLGCAKRLVMKHRAVVEGTALPLYQDGVQGLMLEGRTLLVVGLGKIGTGIARRAKAFDMTVIGIRRRPENGGDHIDSIHGPSELASLLPRADYVVLALPLTGDTDQFFGEAEIGAMQSHAFLINIARGNLVQELPLFHALQENRIAGYAADVWWNYTNSFPATYHFPVPSRTGLHKLPSVLGSGDQAANVEGIVTRNLDRGIQALVEFASGRPLTGEVDLELGY